MAIPCILPKSLNKKIGKAMHDYSMLSDGDSVLLGVSGGVDSSVLTAILNHWKKKAPIEYDLKTVYIDNGFWKPEYGGRPPQDEIAQFMESLDVEFLRVEAWDMPEDELTCFLCSRNRRSQLFDLAKEMGVNKIALGHHMDDLIETLFINMLYSGNISTMVPSQPLFEGEINIIRPMAYLEKNDVLNIAEDMGIKPIPSYCGIDKDSKREQVRELLETIYAQDKKTKKSIFNSLKNIRNEYLL